MELNGLSNKLLRLLFRMPGRNDAGQIAHKHPSPCSIFHRQQRTSLLQTCLLQDAVESARRKVVVG